MDEGGLTDAVPGASIAGQSDEREALLASRIRLHDRRAFEQLYESLRPRLTRFLLRLVAREALVEEVVNDTMMVVWEDIDAFKGESRLSTWVFAIAYRKGMKALARNDAPVDDEADDTRKSDALDPEEQTALAHRQRALRQAIDGLSADHRTVMDLTYFHEMGYREIAAIMDCPVDTVKTRMFHARRLLKRSLSGDRSDWL
jgi:RNA polymerase sigma-70 factor (ECF subfamily)